MAGTLIALLQVAHLTPGLIRTESAIEKQLH
jgi:hypothetical protein